MKIIYKLWLNLVGLVVTEDPYSGERKLRVGIGFGKEEDFDTDHVAGYGNTLPVEVLKEIIKVVEKK